MKAPVSQFLLGLALTLSAPLGMATGCLPADSGEGAGPSFFCALDGRAVGVSAQEPLDDIAGYVARAVADWEAPGLAVVVVKDGEVTFEEAYGVRALDGDEPVTAETLFAIGSTTKAMTAAALGMLVDEGRVGWDDPVTRHLPGFQLSDPYVTRELRVRDLLTHNAGLGNADYLWYGKETTTEEILERIRHAPLAYSLRASFIYQNIMYAAAGEVVEAASGMPWTRFIEERIFGPLGMTGSVTTLAAARSRPNVAAPHHRVDGRIVRIENASVDPIPAAGSIWSSVADMSRWMRFLLAGGVTPAGERLLSERTFAELFRPHVVVPAGQFYPTARLIGPRWTTYGLGWFQHDYRGRAVDFHTGSIDGMVAILGMIRDEGLGVVVLANLDHAEVRHALMYRIFDRYGGGEVRDWSAELAELYGALRARADSAGVAEDQARIEGTTPSLPLTRYAGSYQDELYGSVTVSARDGGLRLRYGPGLQGDLTHWHFDTFRVTWDARWRGHAQVTFTLDASGAPEALEIGGSTFSRAAEGRE